MIIKVGGKTENNSILNQLEMYNTLSDAWTAIPIEASVMRIPSSAGLVQISPNELIIFGGMIGDIKQNESYKMEFNNECLRIRRCCELYSESTFTNPCVVHNRNVIALQNSTRGTTKNLVRFTGSTWKFISC
jgi:hypothetical protein